MKTLSTVNCQLSTRRMRPVIFSQFVAVGLLITACLGEREPVSANPDSGPKDSEAEDMGLSVDAGVGEDAAAEDAEPEAFGLELGEACVADAECASHVCAMPCQGYGVCVASSCQADIDCVVPGSERTHCCVDNQCAPIEGAACGARAGGQGASCGAGGATDCAAGFACLDACVSTSYCAASCTARSDCEAIDPTLSCFHTVGGGQRCVVDPDQLVSCATDRDCDPDTVCTAGLSYEGTSVIKTCTAPTGARIMGAACNSGQDCRSGFCFGGFCTAACSADEDCACHVNACRRSQTCLDVWFEIRGSMAAVKMCSPARRCDSTTDCAAPEVCQPYAERTAWTTTCGAPGATRAPVGAPCTDSAQCQTRACFGSACRALCTSTSTSACGGTESCQEVAMEGPSAPELQLCVGQ